MLTPATAQSGGAALAQIEAIPTDNGLTLTIGVVALADVEGVAEVSVVRKGRAGEVRTSQSQAFDLAASETTTVARLGISMAAGDSLLVEALLTSGGKVISTTRLENSGAD
jgi:hypothetical protein